MSAPTEELPGEPTGEPAGRDPLVEVRGLTARAGDRLLLDGVDLRLAAGRVTALVGPSGSGKTTTALALLGEYEPGVRLSGEITVAGVPVLGSGGVTDRAAEVRGGTLAYMPQHPGSALNPARRTGAVLTELARLHRPEPGRTPAESAAAALAGAQLPYDRGTLRRFPHQFSGGQRQRVALAQVLACGPRVLVLDEPGTGLDAVTRLHLTRELTALAGQGLALLLLSHDHGLVRALADRAVRLEAGRVAAEGSPAEVLPRTAPTAPRPRPQSPPPVAAAEGLEVSGLHAWLRPGGRGRVLHDIGLRLAPGGCLAVAGRSGSGKTTLARCLAGLHERRSGRVRLDGVELDVLRRRSTAQIRRLQYVWQEAKGSFDPRRPVLDQVARTAVRLRALSPAAARAEAAALLDELGVPEETARRGPGGLSGGELQRAAFARAALARPRVLICDEVTSALDPVATARLLAVADRLRSEGTALLWISHELGLVRELAEHLMILDAGRVAEAGECAALLAAPRSAVGRELVEAAPGGQEPAEDRGPAAVPGPGPRPREQGAGRGSAQESSQRPSQRPHRGSSQGSGKAVPR
ncbi:ABC transporter ATP-binding protein [Streptomyces physcomitrii]|uniref:ABC transporter ATP-binding protein n=1 Tax=Streptomyces physcomitrii TaxID=2724184 RepID=UPI0028A9BD08|nr:ATP-binding cassette domain-containing protein [Streptomyces physcomitrii]